MKDLSSREDNDVPRKMSLLTYSSFHLKEVHLLQNSPKYVLTSNEKSIHFFLSVVGKHCEFCLTKISLVNQIFTIKLSYFKAIIKKETKGE